MPLGNRLGDADMAHMILNCPHCGSNRITFDIVGSSRAYPPQYSSFWNLLLQCRHCLKAIVAELCGIGGTDPAKCEGDPRSHGFVIKDIPSVSALVPEQVDEEIAADFEEAVAYLKAGRFTSAGIMFRRVLEQATIALDPTSHADSLYIRIEKLAKASVISKELQESATIIRIEGNTAAHGAREEFTSENAEQLHQFTELFLTYAFTLPAKVKAYYNSVTSTQED